MSRNQVIVLNDVNIAPDKDRLGDVLHFQFCRYVIETRVEYGYRFMWSRDGRLLPLRGGARIPSVAFIEELLEQAKVSGWGNKTESNPQAMVAQE
jgi:hypothetical protein